MKSKIKLPATHMMPRRFSLEEIENMETIHQGQFDNMKLEGEGFRVWLSRMTVADGMPYDNQVTVEQLQDGAWKTIDEYQPQ